MDYIMPKKIKHIFYQKLTFEKLMEAHQRARKHKAYRDEVIQFELNLENNITNLLNRIKNKTYHLGKYRSFLVYEPKKRVIEALPYVDRIVHQWYVEEFIKPYIIPKFISTTYACLPGRGTHQAVSQTQFYMRAMEKNFSSYWILKCDITKFFYHIHPAILYRIIEKYIADSDLLYFTKLLIFDSRFTNTPIGIPIGNYTSQFFANIYLNEFDQYIKRTLLIPYYVRYMDDFVLLLPSKEDCILVKELIEDFLREHLHLTLNDKSKYYPSKMGVNFCGYRIFSTHRLLRTRSKKEIKKKLKIWNQLYAKNTLNIPLAMQILQSWKGHASHCNSFKLQSRILQSADFLLTPNTFSKIEKDLLHEIDSYHVHNL